MYIYAEFLTTNFTLHDNTSDSTISIHTAAHYIIVCVHMNVTVQVGAIGSRNATVDVIWTEAEPCHLTKLMKAEIQYNNIIVTRV